MGNLISACPERVREGWAPGIDGTVRVLPFVKADSLFFHPCQVAHFDVKEQRLRFLAGF